MHTKKPEYAQNGRPTQATLICDLYIHLTCVGGASKKSDGKAQTKLSFK